MNPHPSSTVAGSPRCTAAIYTKARQLIERCNYRDAAVMFRLMLYVAPSDERGWLGLALCHERQAQTLVARELYMLGAKATKSAKCHIACARLLLEEGRHDQAIEQFDEAIRLATDHGDGDVAAIAVKERDLCHVN